MLRIFQMVIHNLDSLLTGKSTLFLGTLIVVYNIIDFHRYFEKNIHLYLKKIHFSASTFMACHKGAGTLFSVLGQILLYLVQI